MSVRSLNKVMLIGNLTRDPEVRFTGNGTAVATFGMATNRSWKDSGGNVQESAEFHNIVAWAKLAEICQQLLKKGMKVYIEGSLTTRSWDDEATGVKKYKTEIRVEDMIILSGKGVGSATSDDASGGAGDDAGDFDEISVDEVEEKKPSKKGKKADKDENPLEEDLPF